MDLKENGGQQIALTSTIDGNTYVVYVKNIIYITRYKDSNNTYVYYLDAFSGRMMCVSVSRTSLNDFYSVLPNQFKKVNRSVIVNLRYVTYYNKDVVGVWSPSGEKLTFDHTCNISHHIVEI